MKFLKNVILNAGALLLAVVPTVFILAGFSPILVTLLAFIAALPLYFTLFISGQQIVEITSATLGGFTFIHSLFHGYGIFVALGLACIGLMAAFSIATVAIAVVESQEETGSSSLFKNVKNAFYTRPMRLVSKLKDTARSMSFVSNSDIFTAPLATVDGAPEL